jgi:hypothetical protein
LLLWVEAVENVFRLTGRAGLRHALVERGPR